MTSKNCFFGFASISIVGAFAFSCSSSSPSAASANPEDPLQQAPVPCNPDSSAPDSSELDSSAPDSSVPDSSAPDSSETDSSAPDSCAPDLPAEPDLPAAQIEPDGFDGNAVDVVTVIRTQEDRKSISPLIYGMNTARAARESDLAPADVLKGTTFIRRGGDRSNSYNWETNMSNSGVENGLANDMFLAEQLDNPSAPGELDRSLIASNLAAGRGTMIPFVLNDYVAATLGSNIPYSPNWDANINKYFNRIELVKPSLFSATPDLNDGVVYTDEHIDFLRHQFPTDIFAPGPARVMVGSDNEPDLFAYNYPMLQRGSGMALYYPAGSNNVVGHLVTGTEFTNKFIIFAKRVKQMAPSAPIVGPDHYHYDGWTTWWDTMPQYTDAGRWYMDDFLATVRAESESIGTRLLDTWDFHWYPQRVFSDTFTWALDNAARTMTADEIDAVVQGPRSYWDPDYDEHSWITDDHLVGPAYILTRLIDRIAADYPGTNIGVTEYFPGGCAHISSGLATADTLGVFGRMGVHVAAMWQHECDLSYAYGGFRLLRNADGQGVAFAGTSVSVEHPEKVESSVYAANDVPGLTTVLVINKTSTTRRFGLRVYDSVSLTDVDVYRIASGSPSPVHVTHEAFTKLNAYAYEAPAMSAALLVLRAH
ncbi:MAG: hypothetical protein FWD73_07495 [Polyangiaceae bacterium]|nr:hypothetical protein [Polyangiaceae bacterium]